MPQKDIRDLIELCTLRVDCPACPGQFEQVELVRLEKVHCPQCGKDWRVRTQDVPGRALVDLLPCMG